MWVNSSCKAAALMAGIIALYFHKYIKLALGAVDDPQGSSCSGSEKALLLLPPPFEQPTSICQHKLSLCDLCVRVPRWEGKGELANTRQDTDSQSSPPSSPEPENLSIRFCQLLSSLAFLLGGWLLCCDQEQATHPRFLVRPPNLFKNNESKD